MIFQRRAERVVQELSGKRERDWELMWLNSLYAIMLELQERAYPQGHELLPIEVGRVIREIHKEIGDDNCWMDIDKIFVAAGLTVPDRSVGDKTAMLVNCHKFVNNACTGNKSWASYKQLRDVLGEVLDRAILDNDLETKIKGLLDGHDT